MLAATQAALNCSIVAVAGRPGTVAVREELRVLAPVLLIPLAGGADVGDDRLLGRGRPARANRFERLLVVTRGAALDLLHPEVHEERHGAWAATHPERLNTGARLLPNAMAPDTADLDQARTGELREGTIFGILLSLVLAAGTYGGVTASPPEPSGTAILLTFTLASALLYGGAFGAILPYRMPETRHSDLMSPRTSGHLTK